MLTDEDLARMAVSWWKRFRPLARPAYTEEVVRDFLKTIPWIEAEARWETAARIAKIVRQKAARKAALTRKKKAEAARKAAERERQYKLAL